MRSRHCGVMLAALLLLAVVPGRSAGEESVVESGRLVATYDAALGAFNLGEFKVTAAVAGGDYEMAADGRFSLLAGLAYEASGKTTSNGTLAGAAVQPAEFTLEYKGGKKREQRRMSFSHGAVSKVSVVPRKKPNPRRVPITPEQLKDVLDPLTAAFLSVRSDAPAGDLAVCRQTIPVFDGSQRFDLVLTPKRSERLDDEAPSGDSAAAVCRVQYHPVSGHRPDHPGVQFMTKTDEIEAWLVPVPHMGLYVPYKVIVPTAWGSGTLTLTGMNAKAGALRRAEAP